MSNKLFYRGSMDMFSFFNTKENIGNFLKYMFENAIEFSKLIEENGNKKPFPIQYETTNFVYQIDYQFMIYVLGKWVAKQTENGAKLERVLRDYAITSHSLSAISYDKNRRLLAIFFGETISIFTNRDRNKLMNIDYYPQYNQSVLEFNGGYFDFKVVGINKHQMRYFLGKEWDAYMKENDDYFFQNIADQVAFGHKTCKAFWAKKRATNEQKQRFYFGISDTDYLDGVDEIWERNAKA